MSSAEDLELTAMSGVRDALEPLDEEARARVLAWARARYGGAPASLGGGEDPPRLDDPASFGSLSDLFFAAGPSNGLEQALVTGYWFQVVGEQADFGGGQLNDALKDLGHGLTNVTRTLEQLRGRKPSLVMQVAKAGRNRQARKRYKLTDAGIKAVKSMLARPKED